MAKNRDLSKFPNAITVLDNGNVGIGTNNFSTVISSRELKVGSDTNGAFVLGNTTTSIYGFVYGSTNSIDIGSGNAITLQTWNGTTYAERMRLANGGNVGISTNSPSFKLDVAEAGSVISGTATIGSNMKGIRIYNTTSATNNNAVGVWFSTGPHQAGIASFRATADTTWETSLAFYTHIDTTSNLTDATEKMRISGQGYVTQPSQPSFYATSTAGSSSYTGSEVIVFNTTRHNIGSHYNTSNGRFTVPVTGRYLLSLNVYNYAGYTNSIVLTINGNQYQPQDVSPLSYAGNVGSISTGFTVIWELVAGDYIEVRVRAGGSAQIYRAHSHFAGHLLG